MDGLEAEIAGHYNFKRIEHLCRIGSDTSSSLGSLRADGQDFVVRSYVNTLIATYQTELVQWLESAGINVECVKRTALGEAFALLLTGKIVTLFNYYPDPPMSVQFGFVDARTWGRLAALMHNACERWHPSVWLRCKLLETSPKVAIERVIDHPIQVPRCREILRKLVALVSTYEPILNAAAFQPVHGDLWPGNILKGAYGLRVIDFGECGDGPRAVDLATAFRWMPWREDPVVAEVLWRTWLSGYREIREPSDIELSSVPALACLQHVSWMMEEISTAEECESADRSWYIEDHCNAIRAIMAMH